MPMNPALQAAIKTLTRIMPDTSASWADQRKAEEAAAKLTIADPRCRIDDLTATAADGYDIPLRLFTPLDIDLSLKTGLHVNEDYRGTILFFHGGGFANGDIGFYTDACQRMALKLERRVLSVEYRRSPEHKFPTALDDCYEVARQLYAGTLLPDVKTKHIVLMGDSAGGNLAAGVSLLARDRGEFAVRTQVLLYPLTYNDHSLTTLFDSVRENGEDYLLTREDIVTYINLYLAKPEDFNDSRFAPLLASSVADQPRTLIVTAEYDPLRDEGEAYAARLEAEGNEVVCCRMYDAIHGYFLYPSVLSLVRDTYRLIANFLDDEDIPDEGALPWLPLLGTD